ncbi:DNA-binding protein [Candidatus Francisella endociliophora]|uniref:DNA-binding protein n=1 Tax=Candidatus Francisella endociliophora TaxID=653937 RepID=A0A097ENM7_9GAMM|nr:helix-turn-helix domain-containing protein [Francisella sp. FSC1006]AIT09164.1 DNA-binding protein [Francisella sp. FSC1006]
MHSFQLFIKNTRESKELEQKTIADAINLSEETINMIEQASNDQLLQCSSSLLKNQIRRYCEYLEIPEKKIISILNKIDILYYKKSQYGKLKAFDYINRLTILIIAIVIVTLVTKHVRENIDTTNIASQTDSKTSIIYTPIDYAVDNSGEKQNIPSTNNDNSSSQNSSSEEKTNHKSLKAHPPATANMSNMVIDEPNN